MIKARKCFQFTHGGARHLKRRPLLSARVLLRRSPPRFRSISMAAKELPIDIVTEILLRLPTKTLIRLQSISKSWYSLISSSPFQKAHLHRSQQNPLFFIAQNKYQDNGNLYLDLSTHDKEGTLLTNFSIPVNLDYVVRIQSCHGLVCLVSMKSILIFNPSTKYLIALPPPPIQRIGLAIGCFGFGYAASTKEFKLVRFLHPDGEQEDSNYCDVLTLGTSNLWRKKANGSPYPVFIGATFLHGALHLQPLPATRVDYIATFDIETEDFNKIQLPECVTTVARPMCLKDFGGSLCLAFDNRIQQSKFELWILKDYVNREWVRYTFDLSSISHEIYWADLLAIMGDGCVLLSVLFEVEKKMRKFLYWYDTEDKLLSHKIAGNGSTVNIGNDHGTGMTLTDFDPHSRGVMALYVDSFFSHLGSSCLI